MVNGLHLFAAFVVFQPLKKLHNRSQHSHANGRGFYTKCKPAHQGIFTHTDGRASELQLPQSNILALSSCYYIYTYHIIMKIQHENLACCLCWGFCQDFVCCVVGCSCSSSRAPALPVLICACQQSVERCKVLSVGQENKYQSAPLSWHTSEDMTEFGEVDFTAASKCIPAEM